MTQRFRSRYDLGLGTQKSARLTSSLITEGILDCNVDASTPGTVRVALWNEWRAMLDDLQGMGSVWSIVRNEHSVLAVQRDYPRFVFSSDQQAAHACDRETSLRYHFPDWRSAVGFDSGCCCGRLYGMEIENAWGEVFHRICLMKGTELTPFIEWLQTHQATGLEIEKPVGAVKIGKGRHQAGGFPPGALQVSAQLLRTVLITAAQREIPLIASVANDGINQTARLEVARASEAHGWLVLSGDQRSLYVESEPTATLLVEPGTMDGESIWRLSLIDTTGDRTLRLQSTADGRPAWNQLVRELVLHASES